MPRTATQAELLADPTIVPNNDVWTESDTTVMSANGLLFYYREGDGVLPYASLPILGPSIAPGSCFPARPSVSRCPPACSVVASMSIVDLVDCVESLGRLPALQATICTGTEECPTLCELLEDPLLNVSAAVDCIPGGSIPEWTQVIINQPEATPEVITVAIEGAGKADFVRAILCPPCGDVTVQLKDSLGNDIGGPDVYVAGTTTTKTAPDATVMTTDGLTPVQGIRSNATGNLPQSVIKYKDAANASQVTAASNTEFSVTLRPATEIPRREFKSALGVGAGIFASVDALVADTLPAIPNVRIAKRDGTTVDVDYVKTPTAVYTEANSANVVHEYSAGANWSKPSAANFAGCWVMCVGAGGGGGSGARRATSVTASSGGGGGGGAVVWRWIPAASLGATETVTIGAGGAGGAAISVNNTNGNAGSVGGDTSFGALVIAKGGGSGQGSGSGGTNSGLSSACTPARGPWSLSGAQRVASTSSADGTAGSDGFNGSQAAPSGGGGGPIDGGNNQYAGGAGGGCWNNTALTAGPAGGAVGGGAGVNGSDDVHLYSMFGLGPFLIGVGTAGSGGGAQNSGAGAAGSGGNGGKGAGGGGGGSSRNGGNSGAGGNGGNGLCIVVDVYV